RLRSRRTLAFHLSEAARLQSSAHGTAAPRTLLNKAAAPQRIAFLGNYLPRLCGIATFTHDLCEAVGASVPAAHCYAGAINDRVEGYEYPSRVRFELLEKD